MTSIVHFLVNSSVNKDQKSADAGLEDAGPWSSQQLLSLSVCLLLKHTPRLSNIWGAVHQNN